MRPIGYYVHHQGFGHFDRGRRVAQALNRPCTLIGTLPARVPDNLPTLRLPDDQTGPAVALPSGTDLPHAMHYAPPDFAPLRKRMCLIADWIAENDPALMIVDVSVEIALFCRLLSVPVVAVRLAGNRTDAAHLEAFRAARQIMAPFPAGFEDGATPTWVRAKTIYAGFLPSEVQAGGATTQSGTVGVVLGSGGASIDISMLVEAARATPDRAWHIFGRPTGAGQSSVGNLTCHGFVEDIDRAVAPMEVLVGAAGDGVLALAVRHAKLFVCLPEPRPYDEQVAKAQVLAAYHAAVVRPAWPRPDEWAAVLDEAAQLDVAAIGALRDNRAFANAVAIIEDMATARDGYV